jgi:ABC-type glycerol-3-phosphate transport system permease component
MNEIPATYRFVGLANYTRILTDGTFFSRLGWTAVWTLGCTVLHVGLGLGLALLLNRRVRFRSLYRVLLAVNVWLGVPFMMLALLGGLQAVPRELYEAAAVDGATPWQRFRHITLPGLRPVSRTVVLLGTIWTFNQFGVIYLVTRGGPGDSTEIPVTYAWRDAFEGIRDYSGSAAYGVLILLLLVAMVATYHAVRHVLAPRAAARQAGCRGGRLLLLHQAWGEVAYATAFMTGDTKYTLAVGLQQFVGQQKAEWGLMTASSVMIAAPAAVIFLLVQRHLVTGLTSGATKS